MRARLAAAFLAAGLLAGWCLLLGAASWWLLFARPAAPGSGREARPPLSRAVTAPPPQAGRPGPRTGPAASPSRPPATPDGEGGRPGEGTAAVRAVTATPAPPRGSVDLPRAVDWPATPDLAGREPLTSTQHFRVYPFAGDDVLLREQAAAWAPRLEGILAGTGRRLGGRRLAQPVDLVFARSYPARCPARGLAATQDDPPLLMVFLDEETSDLQVAAVLAHEMAHHLSLDERFVGDGVLTEGIANWAGGPAVLRWQGFATWPAAVRRYWREGRYQSVADPDALRPRGGEDCIARRDRVYNIRTAFVSWLIDRVGLETVLAMPVAEVTWADPAGTEAGRARLPDYERAAGAGLAELERRFLASLGLGGPEVMMLELRPELEGVDIQ